MSRPSERRGARARSSSWPDLRWPAHAARRALARATQKAALRFHQFEFSFGLLLLPLALLWQCRTVGPRFAQASLRRTSCGASWCLHSHLGEGFNGFHTWLYALQAPLQDLAGGGDAGVGGVPRRPTTLAGPHLGTNCTAHGGVDRRRGRATSREHEPIGPWVIFWSAVSCLEASPSWSRMRAACSKIEPFQPPYSSGRAANC